MDDTYGDRMLAMMRNQFGGHQVYAAEETALRR
jgi:6-phosphogluconate dehydrogenase (decarboxylating)